MSATVKFKADTVATPTGGRSTLENLVTNLSDGKLTIIFDLQKSGKCLAKL